MENNKKIYEKHEKNAKNTKKTQNFTKNDKILKYEDKIEFKKSLGQNFLFDKNLLNAIVVDGGVCSSDLVLEIGAGAGTLTEAIAKKCKRVISFEIDKSLKQILDEKAEQNKNIEFHFEDFMNVDIDEFIDEKCRVVANIPYYITTPIIFKLVEKLDKIKSISVLIQKEVAERFAGDFGSKTYGITSVILQSVFDVTIPRIVKKECFTPMPKIDSALCKLVPHSKYNISDFEKFKDFVHKSFSMRRKTLVNNLKTLCEKGALIETLSKYGYSEMVRPEDISVENFVNIFNDLNNCDKLILN